MSDANPNVDNLLTFVTGASGIADGDLIPVEVRCREAISTLFEVEAMLECDVDGGIAQEASQELFTSKSAVGFGPGAVHTFAGIVRRWELLSMQQDGKRSRYRAFIAPRFWLTTLTHRSRCFNEKSFPEILEVVLQETGLAAGDDYELKLSESYASHEYISQYQETDFAFLSRWMERLGIFYFFDCSSGIDKIIFTDTHAELVEVTDNPTCTLSDLSTLQLGVGGSVHELRRVHRKLPMTAMVNDYNWRDPSREISGRVDIDADYGTGLQYFYGDHFKDDGEAETRARIRAEAQACHGVRYHMNTANPDFAPGFKLAVEGTALGEMDLGFVIVAVNHQAEMGTSGTYGNQVEAIEETVPYRAPIETPWPKIAGVMHARIDAESINSAAPLSEDGRYRVVIPYDLYGDYGGSATRWVRKAEPYSGDSYGMHFTLHVGAEVLLAHVGGDPDRPVIVGSPPNPGTGSPLTQTDATRSAIRTRSGILIDFEDDA